MSLERRTPLRRNAPMPRGVRRRGDGPSREQRELPWAGGSQGGHSRSRLRPVSTKIVQPKPLSYEWPEASNAGVPAQPRPKAPKTKQRTPASLRKAVLTRDEVCVARDLLPNIKCLGDLQAHHLWRRSQGGPDEEWNMKAVCAAHHEWIHRNVAKARALDLIRRSGQTGPDL